MHHGNVSGKDQSGQWFQTWSANGTGSPTQELPPKGLVKPNSQRLCLTRCLDHQHMPQGEDSDFLCVERWTSHACTAERCGPMPLNGFLYTLQAFLQRLPAISLVHHRTSPGHLGVWPVGQSPTALRQDSPLKTIPYRSGAFVFNAEIVETDVSSQNRTESHLSLTLDGGQETPS
jgi:hypothetical protein